MLEVMGEKNSLNKNYVGKLFLNSHYRQFRINLHCGGWYSQL